MKPSPYFIFLPLVAYALFVLIFVRKRSVEGLLNALTKGHLVFFTFIAVSTEILSAFHAIDFPHLLGLWGSVCCVGCVLAFVISKNRRDGSLPEDAFPRPSPVSIFLLGAVGFVVAITFTTAILYAPNNWDSMTYHLARVP
ncbi:MAG: hypothetical protein JWO45_1913, partial [Spartobacteria bacterium]|nr:hypothetical protein [Spartobacteria bacterium]